MITRNRLLSLAVVLCMLFSLTACWNYREVNQMTIVVGVAVDPGENGKYLVTIELEKIKGGRETETSSVILSREGESVLDAIRSFIAISGKKTYWGHVQIVIINETIGREGIIDALSFFRVDAEVRGNVHILISREKTAKEVLESDSTTENIISFTVRDSLRNSRDLATIPKAELDFFAGELLSEAISATAPTIFLEQQGEKRIPFPDGTAVFSFGKLVGFFNGDETKAMLFLKDEFKSGIIVVNMKNADIALEIYRSRTKRKARFLGDTPVIEVMVEISAVVNEILGFADIHALDVIAEIERQAEETIKNQLEKTIETAQTRLSADAFGFGEEIHQNYPQRWKEISSRWNSEFCDLQVIVNVKVNIENTAIVYKPLKKGKE